jgi:hypothetical protein
LLKLKVALVYAILACIHEMKVHETPVKQVSICSVSQVALKPLRDVRTIFPVGLSMPKGIK